MSNHKPSKVWDEINYPFPSFNDAIVEVWEWINNFILHFIMDIINYPCWNKSKCMLVKGSQMTFAGFVTRRIVALHSHPFVYGCSYSWLLIQWITVNVNRDRSFHYRTARRCNFEVINLGTPQNVIRSVTEYVNICILHLLWSSWKDIASSCRIMHCNGIIDSC